MPLVRVLLPRSLRSYWGGEAETTVEADTVAAAVQALGAKHPGLASRILDERGRPRQHVHLFVNQEAVHLRDLDSVRLREGDTLHVLPAVSGGDGSPRARVPAEGPPPLGTPRAVVPAWPT